MNVDKSDYDKATDHKRADKIAETTSNLRMVRQAAVNAEKLTADPAWDQFLSYLQAIHSDTEKLAQTCLNTLSDPNVVNPDQLIAAKIAKIRCDDRLAMLELVMKLPKEIKEKGHLADNHLLNLQDIAE